MKHRKEKFDIDIARRKPVDLRSVILVKPWDWPTPEVPAPKVIKKDPVEPESRVITYYAETAESVAQHAHPESAPGYVFKGHTRTWYENFGLKCPTCPHTPEFEEVTFERQSGFMGLRMFTDS